MNDRTIEGAGYNLRPDTVITAGSGILPKNVAAKHVFCYPALEIETDPVGSMIFGICGILVPFLGGRKLYNTLLGDRVGGAIEDRYRWCKRFLGKQ